MAAEYDEIVRQRTISVTVARDLIASFPPPPEPPPPEPLPDLEPGFCAALNRTGRRCARRARKGKPFCPAHPDGTLPPPRMVVDGKDRIVYLASLVREDIRQREEKLAKLEKDVARGRARAVRSAELLELQRPDVEWKQAVLRGLDRERDMMVAELNALRDALT